MRGLPQPPDQPSVEGCSLVELPDDAVDVELVLKALYTPTFLTQTALPMAAIGAFVRTGRKYDFKICWTRRSHGSRSNFRRLSKSLMVG
ncbi:hypothetical protein K438DRAFT_1868486 [Mycena galopus ATCC 62051]|nr:hypothetical protein K438DRAFT_1868486 [Mycena galopus ATCC 62051]